MYHLRILFIACLAMAPITASADSNSPAGLWKAHNDKGVATGYIRIREDNGVFTGVIERGLESDKEDKYCNACKDERKNQKLVGMTIIKNLKEKDNAYIGDEILDPFSGNTYRVKVVLKEAGNSMEVKGFVGISLFGRTQIWRRIE